MTDPMEEAVEDYIDKHGMVHMLTLLINVCYEKADHVQVNWQDRSLASAWRRAVIGPFRTVRGAEFMRQYGEGNPHCQTVGDAERLAKQYAAQAEKAAER